MTLSQEILVLDFGDDKQSEFSKNDASIDFNDNGEGFCAKFVYYFYKQFFK